MIRRFSAFACMFLLVCTLLFSSAYAGESLVWPADGEVITEFGVDSHRGIDIATAVGGPIVSAAEGVVYWVGRTPRGEPCISIDHPNGLSTTYLPVESSIRKGQEVVSGQVIGVLTADGDVSSDKPHLHFGLFETATRDNKRYLDPQDYLAASSAGQSPEQSPAPAIEQVAPPTGVEIAPTRGVETELQPGSHTVPVPVSVERPASVAINEALPVDTVNQSQVGAPTAAMRPSSISVGTTANVSGTAQAKSNVSVTPVPGMPAGVMPTEIVNMRALSPTGRSVVGGTLPLGVTAAGTHGSVRPMISQASATHTTQGAPGQSITQATEPGVAHAVNTAGPNPFTASTAKSTSAEAAATQGVAEPAQQAGRASMPKVAGRFLFGWHFLPELILACVLAIIIMQSIRFIRRVKRRPQLLWMEPAVGGAMVA